MNILHHYSSLLAPVYTWMLGGFDTAAERNLQFFDRHRIEPVSTGLALDLGAGSGVQSIPLARRGFRVIAVDFCDDLLKELRTHAGDLPIETRQADLLAAIELPVSPELIVCMGDTLTHLRTVDDARNAILNASRRLAPGGTLILTYRDLSRPLEGTGRFIPVRADDHTILTCFLEWHSESVTVYDILHTHTAAGWQQSISSYSKLILPQRIIRAWIEEAGLAPAVLEDTGGMFAVIARKP